MTDVQKAYRALRRYLNRDDARYAAPRLMAQARIWQASRTNA